MPLATFGSTLSALAATVACAGHLDAVLAVVHRGVEQHRRIGNRRQRLELLDRHRKRRRLGRGERGERAVRAHLRVPAGDQLLQRRRRVDIGARQIDDRRVVVEHHARRTCGRPARTCRACRACRHAHRARHTWMRPIDSPTYRHNHASEPLRHGYLRKQNPILPASRRRVADRWRRINKRRAFEPAVDDKYEIRVKDGICAFKRLRDHLATAPGAQGPRA